VSTRRESLHGLVFETSLAGVGEIEASGFGASFADAAIDVAAPRALGASEIGSPLVTEWAEPGRAIVLRVRGVGRFDVTRERVIVCADPSAREDLVRLFVRYHALGLLLRLRGFVVLHGAAVSLSGEAHVWVGASGAGKTTAALEACASATGSARFLADEVVALEPRGDAFVVRRGVPWPRVDAGAPAHLHALARRIEPESAHAVPLGCIALASHGAAPGGLGAAALAAQILGGYRPELPPLPEEIASRSRLLDVASRLRR
jgi:hypothetical protein